MATPWPYSANTAATASTASGSAVVASSSHSSSPMVASISSLRWDAKRSALVTRPHTADPMSHPPGASQAASVPANQRALATPASRGCGQATDQKAVRRRGPGRVVLGSKPQLATTEQTCELGCYADSASTVLQPQHNSIVHRGGYYAEPGGG